jgi:hypothetical protein
VHEVQYVHKVLYMHRILACSAANDDVSKAFNAVYDARGKKRFQASRGQFGGAWFVFRISVLVLAQAISGILSM